MQNKEGEGSYILSVFQQSKIHLTQGQAMKIKETLKWSLTSHWENT